MMKYKYTLVLAFAFATLCSQAQITTQFTASKANEYGLTYSLPKTAFDIVVETQHTVTQPGEFANYAKRHLAINDAITRADKSVTVSSITIVPRGIPDADNRWLVQFKTGANVSMSLNDGGIPLTINTPEVAKQATRTLPQAREAAPTPLETDAARQAITPEMMRSTSLSKKAELAAARIFELREQRNELISGNADNMPPDGGALTVALAGLDAQEKALTAMFAGTQKQFTRVQTYTFVPGSNDVSDSLICRVSPVSGLVEINDLSGLPLTISVQTLSRGTMPVNEKGEAKRFPRGGVAYNIPGAALITVKLDGHALASEQFDMTQMGVTFGLDPAIFSSKKEPMQAVFSPVTGAILDLSPAK